jgi:hypothetical protein
MTTTTERKSTPDPVLAGIFLAAVRDFVTEREKGAAAAQVMADDSRAGEENNQWLGNPNRSANGS